jgi:hypothetical protein
MNIQTFREVIFILDSSKAAASTNTKFTTQLTEDENLWPLVWGIKIWVLNYIAKELLE